MPSKTDIANVALGLIGGTRITSFGQGTKNANLVNDLYDPLRLHLLAFPWNFATQRIKLAQLTEVPTFEFDFAYALPSDWIYTMSVHGSDAGRSTTFYKEEQLNGQNVLLSNEQQLFLRYVKDEEDPNLWSPNFRRAMSSALARDLSIPIANSNTLQARMEIRARRDLNKAQGTDALGSFPERRPRGSWANSRSGPRSRFYFGT